MWVKYKNKHYMVVGESMTWMDAQVCIIEDLLRLYLSRVWRYQRGNQNPYIEEEQTTQWPKRKSTKRSTKHTSQAKDRVTGTPPKTGDERRCSESDTSRVNLVTNPVISHKWGKEWECLQQVEHTRGHLWHRYSITVNQVMVAAVKRSTNGTYVIQLNFVAYQY